MANFKVNLKGFEATMSLDQATEALKDMTQGQWVGLIQSERWTPAERRFFLQKFKASDTVVPEQFPQEWLNIPQGWLGLVACKMFTVSKSVNTDKFCTLTPVGVGMGRLEDAFFENPYMYVMGNGAKEKMLVIGNQIERPVNSVFEQIDMMPKKDLIIGTRVAGMCDASGVPNALFNKELKVPNYTSGSPVSELHVKLSKDINIPASVGILDVAKNIPAQKLIEAGYTKAKGIKPSGVSVIDKESWATIDKLMSLPKRFSTLAKFMDIPHQSWNAAMKWAWALDLIRAETPLPAKVNYYGASGGRAYAAISNRFREVRCFDLINMKKPERPPKMGERIFEILSRDQFDCTRRDFHAMVESVVEDPKRIESESMILSDVWAKNYKQAGIVPTLVSLLNSQADCIVKFSCSILELADLEIKAGTIINTSRPSTAELMVTNRMLKPVMNHVYPFLNREQYHKALRAIFFWKLTQVSKFRQNFEGSLLDPWIPSGRKYELSWKDMPIIFANAKTVKGLAVSDLKFVDPKINSDDLIQFELNSATSELPGDVSEELIPVEDFDAISIDDAPVRVNPDAFKPADINWLDVGVK